MNGNGQVIVAGLFPVTSIAVAMFAVGMFEVPTYEPEAKPIELLQIEGRRGHFQSRSHRIARGKCQCRPLQSCPDRAFVSAD